jgi:hypothetical protein
MKTTRYLTIGLATLIAAGSSGGHSAAAQSSNTAVRPALSLIAELQRSPTEKSDDALSVGRLAAEYQQAGRWKAGYDLAMRRLAATPEDAAALYDAGAAAFWVQTRFRSR